MASELISKIARTQVANRLHDTRKVSPAHGEGSGLDGVSKDKHAHQTEQTGLEKKDVTATTHAELSHAVADINQFVQSIQRDLQFSVVEDDTVIEVRNTHTNELVRTIPSEEAVKLAQTLHEALENAGTIFDDRA